ncbi:MAG: carbon-nitrogen hydrolase family protein [Kiritimatiellae bacterium]|nr:carbon-nitrogen hydrolase family protein [Kiritimatiellia bacterium]
MKKIKVATCQFAVANNLQANKKDIIRIIGQAANKKARIILFPECALTNYMSDGYNPTEACSSKEIESALREIAMVAKANKIYVAVGTCLYNKNKKKWFNALVIINDIGKRQCVYNKMALTRGDKEQFEQGSTLPTFIIDGVRFGCQICFDVRFAENYRKLFKKDVHVVLHAYHQAGLPEIVEQRRELMIAFQRVRSSENGIYTIASNTLGLNKGKDQWIPSMIVNSRGDVIKQCKAGRAGIITATIQADEVFENGEIDIREYSASLLDMKKAGKRYVNGV